MAAIYSDARLDGGAGDADQFLVAQTEVLMGDRVFARHARAEVRRVVRAERERDPGLAQHRERMVLIGREDPQDDVARGAHLERDLPAGQLGDQVVVLDRAHAVGDTRNG